MSRRMVGLVLAGLVVGGCEDSVFAPPTDGGDPSAPRAVGASYYAGVVTVGWDLPSNWNGESFRVYAKRVSDSAWYLIAEVTSCAGGYCTYADANVLPGQTYDYYVVAVASGGYEGVASPVVRVQVPQPVPPPVPGGVGVVALDGANFIYWDGASRAADDFAFYRVYLDDQDSSYLLGETDSEGFLDLLAANGSTWGYFVTAVDTQGHESQGSVLVEGTPRPDYHGEVVYDYFSRSDLAGFRFQDSEETNPIVDGDSSSRDFRLEVDGAGWWLVPGPGVRVYPAGFETTALKCGPAADAGCVSLDVAPTSGYEAVDVGLLPQTTYVLQLPDGGSYRYAAVRVELLGYDQDDDALMIFDWAMQLQAGNPNLAPLAPDVSRIR